MALHSTGVKVISAIVLLVGFSGWVISLAGLAKLTDMCRKQEDSWVAAASSFDVMTMTSNSDAYDCGVHFSLYWWIVALELFVVVFGMLGIFFETFHAKVTIMHLLAVASTLYCFFAEYTLKRAYVYQADGDDDDKVGQAVKASAAGCVAVLVCNFLFALVFGQQEVDPAQGPIESKA